METNNVNMQQLESLLTRLVRFHGVSEVDTNAVKEYAKAIRDIACQEASKEEDN